MENILVDLNTSVLVNWDYALNAVKDIDITALSENRSSIKGKPAINILAEYGAIAYKCSTPPDSCRLVIIISPPFVRFCPSKEGLSGILVDEYDEFKHGRCFLEIQKNGLFDFTNIDARLDGWQFFAGMVSLANQNSITAP